MHSGKNLFSIIIILIFLSIFVSRCKVQPGVSEGETEQKVFQLINEHRSANGLAVLGWNAAVAEECRTHSQDMASGATGFGHDGFTRRLDNIRVSVSFSLAGENLALISQYSNPAEKAVQNWLNSQSHLQNIEGDFNLTGVGVAKEGDDTYYITQIFILTDN